MNKKYKVVVTDIDDTLTPVRTNPDPYTVETLEKLMSNGYLLGLASGRPAKDIQNKYKEWNVSRQFDFLIGWNGADLWDIRNNMKYQYNLLKKEWIKEIIEFMSEFDCSIHMYYDDLYLSSKMSDKAWYSAYKNKREFVVTDDISDFYREDNAGIMFRCRMDQMPEIHKKFKTLEDKEYYGYNTQPDLVEFSHRNCNKAEALKKYCELNDITLEEVISFGDTTNDAQMLKISHGVCLLNGSDDAKQAAKQISEYPCDQDGFARYINTYIL